MTGKVEWKYKPLAKQEMFHNSPAKFRLYAGGMGSGKTLAGIAEAWKQTLSFPGNFGLVGRATYPELRDTTWKELINFPIIVDGQEMTIIESPLVASYNKANHEIVTYNGSTIIGRALDDSFHKLAKGLNLGWCYIDELTEVAQEIFEGISLGRLRIRLKCQKCNRYPNEGKTRCDKCGNLTVRHTAFGTTNPEGHDWVWQKFIMNPDPNYFYVQATSEENPNLPSEYIKNLKGMPEEWQKRYLYGSFDTFQGLVYKEFEDKAPHVIKKFDIPEDWYRFIALDHGFRNPTAILWGAVDRAGRLYIYDEFYGNGKRVSELSEIIKAKSKDQKIQQYLIDPSADADRGGESGRTIVDEFADNGIFFNRAKNEVSAGINHVAEYFKTKDGQPKIKIVEHCHNLRIELQTYRWKDIKIGQQTNEPEKPQKKNDHCVDALRYMVNYIYSTPAVFKRRGFDYKAALERRKQTADLHWMAA